MEPLHRSRYPGFDTLAFAHEWDEVTRKVVLARLEPPPLVFFTEAEARTLRAAADVVVPQDDRPPGSRIPVVERVGERLHRGEGRGWRYEEVPPDPEMWRLFARALDEEAATLCGRAFADLPTEEREALWARLMEGDVRAPLWSRIPPRRSVPLVVGEFAEHYYAHPWAWNEIGWPGPRFPRIYARTIRENPEEPFAEASPERGTTTYAGGR